MSAALERIQRAGREEAAAEAARILHEAREQLGRLAEAARSEEEQRAEARLREERAMAEQDLLRQVARARREAKLASLEARNKAIGDVFRRVREEILHLPPERYRGLLRRWLGEIDPSAEGEIIPAPRDSELLAALIAEMGAGSRLKIIRGAAPFESGFIFRTPRYEVTKSLESWLEEERRRMTPWLEGELFGEGRDDGTG